MIESAWSPRVEVVAGDDVVNIETEALVITGSSKPVSGDVTLTINGQIIAAVLADGSSRKSGGKAPPVGTVIYRGERCSTAGNPSCQRIRRLSIHRGARSVNAITADDRRD